MYNRDIQEFLHQSIENRYPSVNGQFGGTNLNLMETTTTNNTAIKAMQNALEDQKVIKKQLGKRKSRK